MLSGGINEPKRIYQLFRQHVWNVKQDSTIPWTHYRDRVEIGNETTATYANIFYANLWTGDKILTSLLP